MAITKMLSIPAEQLRHRPADRDLPFETTEQVPALQGTIGQPRAISAIEFGVQVRSFGYNLYISGAHGSGRESTAREHIARYAETLRTPDDWVYAHNFENPDRPKAIRLPPGKGSRFVHDMDEFIRAAQRQIPRAFESEDYERRRREAVTGMNQKKAAHLEQLQKFARERNFGIEVTPAGFVTIPMANGEPISAEAFEQLSGKSQDEYQRSNKEVQTEIGSTLRKLRQIEKDVIEEIRQMDQDVANFVAGPMLDELCEKYCNIPGVQEHIRQVRQDLLLHFSDFRPLEDGVQQAAQMAQMGIPPAAMRTEDRLARYRINPLIDNSQLKGAPVIIERNPTYYNLVGRVNYRPTFGAMVTDFLQVKPGALHRANGGFLIIHVLDLMKNPFAWDSLKRALLSRDVVIENMGEQMTIIPTATLRPESIPLDVKIILIGPPQVYQLLHHYDEDFPGLFKVKADFSPEMDWNEESIAHYAGFISRCVRDYGLKHFTKAAVGRIVEFGARLMDDQRKLSTRLAEIGDAVTESSFWAQKAGHPFVTAQDVDRAIQQKEYRSNLVEERIRELIADNTILIDTRGEKVGQVNGIAIAIFGDHAFGKPSRITASLGLGRGTLTSVEREIKLSGPIHSKGFLILTGYLGATYAQKQPLAVSATITFEQSYDEVEGDSASSAELYAVLSALSGLPIKQNIAVTGSVNQRGEVQAVGGVTRKIEGYFAVCKTKGLTGDQGVIIPKANVPTLMLSDEVIQAVEMGRFHVWAVSSIDEGIELLTGAPAGRMEQDGHYTEGSVHRRAADRLNWYADQLRLFQAPRPNPEIVVARNDKTAA